MQLSIALHYEPGKSREVLILVFFVLTIAFVSHLSLSVTLISFLSPCLLPAPPPLSLSHCVHLSICDCSWPYPRSSMHRQNIACISARSPISRRKQVAANRIRNTKKQKLRIILFYSGCNGITMQCLCYGFRFRFDSLYHRVYIHSRNGYHLFCIHFCPLCSCSH